jgi:acetoin utilization deacetylase AcuC-like enzyme
MLKVAWSPAYVLPLPPNHRFPMSKYEVLPQQLLYEGTLKENNFFRPDAADEKRILAVHDSAYWNKLKNLSLTPAEIRRTGFPLTERPTIKIHPLTLNTLKNIVYTKKTMGFTDYTQTKALSEAINLLAQSLPLKNRPASIQKNEQKRSIIIARSIAKRKKQTKETP